MVNRRSSGTGRRIHRFATVVGVVAFATVVGVVFGATVVAVAFGTAFGVGAGGISAARESSVILGCK
jgi:hypothetical protein